MAISIHALREEGDPGRRVCCPLDYISIHALREEGDVQHHGDLPAAGEFLSTPSARRATPAKQEPRQSQEISIHALREEGDPKRSETQWTESKISIHALREEGDVFFCVRTVDL